MKIFDRQREKITAALLAWVMSVLQAADLRKSVQP